MAAICRLHHIALHVRNVDKIAYDLVSKFKFNLFAARLNEKSSQFAFRNGSAVFIVNERLSNPFLGFEDVVARKGHHTSSQGLNEICCPPFRFGDRKNTNTECNFLYDVHPNYSVDTVSNVCFEVEDVEKTFNALRNQGCDFLVPPTTVRDEKGIVSYSILKSIVGNVCHTLIDKTQYQGTFLPGFENVTKNGARVDELAPSEITHFDHITYACPRRSTPDVMGWYEKYFGFQRFFIDRDEDVNEGFVLNENSIGLRLTAMEYWKCSELGVMLPFKGKEPDCKFVIAESLPEQGRNQVDSFLENHKGAGIQHIGLYTQDIISTAHSLAQAGVEFFSPPPAYYTEVGKQQEIVDAGHDPEELSQYGILLDADLHQDSSGPPCGLASAKKNRHLLQIFTKPIFAEDTFFLELIERRGASGFGEGNIRALWRSVQDYMKSQIEGKIEGHNSESVATQTRQH
ncbi:4-hydroxyphenylpyruvate dioxygenase-like protein [Anguilla rostrata]|uniref:4-hydroxyphenylpyruvate dioxygenase-like protein n=1 Tax=Anguilla rostrata TaxID=7938 RepID=UPI0030CE02D4